MLYFMKIKLPICPTMPYPIAGKLYSIIESRKAKDGLSDRHNCKKINMYCKRKFGDKVSYSNKLLSQHLCRVYLDWDGRKAIVGGGP